MTTSILIILLQNKLIRVQEVAVWSNPTVSVVWVVVSQIILYYLCNWTTSLLSSLCYLLLSVYVYLTWVYTVWPAVRVPPSADEDTEHFTPLHPDVLSAPELQTFLHNLKSRVSQVGMEEVRLCHLCDFRLCED